VKKIYTGIESKVTRYDWGKEVAPGIHFDRGAGHTPGHTVFVVGTAIDDPDPVRRDEHSRVLLRNPDWHVAYDVDPVIAQTTRHKFYDMAAAEKRLWSLPLHLPLDRHVEKDGAKYRLVPVAWNPVI